MAKSKVKRISTICGVLKRWDEIRALDLKDIENLNLKINKVEDKCRVVSLQSARNEHDLKKITKYLAAVVDYLKLEFDEKYVDDPGWCPPERPQIVKLVAKYKDK